MLPKNDQFLMSKKELTEQIVGLLGGRTAEEIIFNSQSTGASNDFEQATDIARGMVTQYGMTDKLGTVALEKEGQPFVGAAYGQGPAFSETTHLQLIVKFVGLLTKHINKHTKLSKRTVNNIS